MHQTVQALAVVLALAGPAAMLAVILTFALALAKRPGSTLKVGFL